LIWEADSHSAKLALKSDFTANAAAEEEKGGGKTIRRKISNQRRK